MISGTLLREARLRAGLTQEELARRAGTTQSAISRWESGSTRPPLEMLRRLVRACGLDLRVGIREYDSDATTLLERTVSLSPAERLDEVTRAAAFLREGRSEMARRRG